MEKTQGDIIIGLLLLITVLLAGKRVTVWLKHDTGSNGTEEQDNEGATQTAKSTSRPSLRVEPKPMTA